jgi:hypothetical protein
MQSRFQRRIARLGLFGPLLFALSGAGAGLELRTQEEPATESTNPFTRYLLRTDWGSFELLPPYLWTHQLLTAEQTVVLTAQDASASIRLKLVEGESGKVPALDTESLRRKTCDAYPGATVVGESRYCWQGLYGPCFDFAHSRTGPGRLSSRVVFLPFRGGYAEFMLTAASDQFDKQVRDLSRVVDSFRIKAGPNKS